MDSDDGLTIEERATNYATMRHIEMVRKFLSRVVAELLDRAVMHDQSKLSPPEVGPFAKYTARLSKSVYGSPEYNGFLEELKPALDHHYAKNRHHPEHYPPMDNGEVSRLADLVEEARGECGKGSPITAYLEEQLQIAESSIGHMNLIDLIEMFCDWKAATLRHRTGNLRKSIEHNAERFHIASQLVSIFENTVQVFDD